MNNKETRKSIKNKKSKYNKIVTKKRRTRKTNTILAINNYNKNNRFSTNGGNNDNLSIEEPSTNIKTKINDFNKQSQPILRKLGEKQISSYLNSICSDSGECIAFGLENEKIKNLFNNFYLLTKPTLIYKHQVLVKPSENGFVVEIFFKNEEFNANTILKCSINKGADNLFYEALVGLFINKKNKFYPCFLETYNVPYIISNDDTYNKLSKQYPEKNVEFIENNITPIDNEYNYNIFFDKENINISCKRSNKLCILIQHIKNAKTIQDHIESYKKEKDFMTVHLINYLYQVYCPLSALSNNFTHYDLHMKNVLIYEPSQDNSKYIRMCYHYPDNTVVEFNTFGVVKIIDYGRSYFNDKEENVNSGKFYTKVCQTERACTPECGSYVGYSWLGEEYELGENAYIVSQHRNKSHDLRLCTEIWYEPDKYKDENAVYIRQILSKIVYKMQYGTPEIAEGIYRKLGDKIANVDDMHKALKELMLNIPYFTKENNRIFENKEKMGEIHTWVDGSKPVEYRSSNIQKKYRE